MTRARSTDGGSIVEREGLDSPPRRGVALDRRFEAIMLDWESATELERTGDPSRLRALVESACELGLHLSIVSSDDLAGVDERLRARPRGPGTLHLLVNRGADAFVVGPGGPRRLEQCAVSRERMRQLEHAARLTIARLAECGLADVQTTRRRNCIRIELVAPGIDGLATAVALAHEAVVEIEADAIRVVTDGTHLELGVSAKSDAAQWLFAQLWRIGVGPSQVLVIDDGFVAREAPAGGDSLLLARAAARATSVSLSLASRETPAGVTAVGRRLDVLSEVLEDQIERRRRSDPPTVDDDPDWTIVADGLDPSLERVRESWLTLGAGRIATRGSSVVPHPAGNPSVLAAGVYHGVGTRSELMAAPLWNLVGGRFSADDAGSRTLDLHAGMLHQRLTGPGGDLDAVLFSSLARPGTTALRVASADRAFAWSEPLADPIDGLVPAARPQSSTSMSAAGHPGGVSVAASQRATIHSDGSRLERLAAYATGPRHPPRVSAAFERLRAAERVGFEHLLDEHRARWARRWEDAGIEIVGDPPLQRAARFALFHLIGSAADGDEAAVGARGMTGPAYRGHVFWDADVFVLPFFAATHPPAARAMLEYRIRRLPAALAASRAEGSSGAHFPWESAARGDEVTPTRGRDRLGRFTAILTGQLEEHIVADVAWAACCYASWTGDEAFLTDRGRGLVLETARWWAGRIELDDGGRGHLRRVMGPDEYHAPVDDNAFTNVMARWNLRKAATLDGADPHERRRWLALADALVDGYDATTRIYEQFTGFHALEPLIIADEAPSRPIAATLLLGDERVAASQVIKQADALMIHYLVPEEAAPGSLRPNLDHYEPRTAHGSSLSPAVYAALLAQTGQTERAVELLRIAAGFDLDDITQTTAAGLHLAAMGGTWQALALGFAGLRPDGETLRINPRLPLAWESLTVPVRFRDARLRIELTRTAVTVRADHPTSIRIDGGETVTASAKVSRFPLDTGGQT